MLTSNETHHLLRGVLALDVLPQRVCKLVRLLAALEDLLVDGTTHARAYPVAWSWWWSEVTPASWSRGEAQSESCSSAGETWKLRVERREGGR
jgi:hypothetical protein